MNRFFSNGLLFTLKHTLYFSCLALLLLLLARNPFSLRTLIPVLDPFPDTIHYTNSAFSILQGKGFVVARNDASIPPDVPVFYSLTLLPSFALFNDVRSFYFTNLVLAIFSFTLFYRIVVKTFHRKRVQSIVLFLYTTSSILTWYATLAMAENLILPLFLLALNISIEKYSWKKSALMAAICVGFYATKYASLPLLAAFAFIYGIKILYSSKEVSVKFKRFFSFSATFVILFGVHETFEYFSKGTSITSQIFPVVFDVFITHSPKTKTGGSTPHNVFFSTEYIVRNTKEYLGWLIGKKLYILWSLTQILKPIWATFASAGLLIGVFKREFRALGLSLLFSLIAVIAFMSLFYTIDGRYVITAIPTLILGLGFFLSVLDQLLVKKFSYLASAFAFAVIAMIILVQSVIPVKSAIMLNLRHAETPWPYISIIRLNQYIKTHRAMNGESTPVVITPLSPYYVDYFRTEKMILLPLSSVQEARADQTKVWGKYDYSNLHQVYTDFLKQGVPVYFASYGIGNDKNMQKTRDDLKIDFQVIEVDHGCENVCNIYQLKLK